MSGLKFQMPLISINSNSIILGIYPIEVQPKQIYVNATIVPYKTHTHSTNICASMCNTLEDIRYYNFWMILIGIIWNVLAIQKQMHNFIGGTID